MFKNRLFIALGVLSLLLVAMVVSFPLPTTPTSTESGLATYVDSATHSYTAWAQAAEVEGSSVDSATRSYIAQAKAVACNVDAAHGLNLDSATRSYIAWGLASEMGALCR